MHILLPSMLPWFITFVCFTLAQNIDPVKNFCVRYDHQSTVKNGALYIGGGVETFVDSQDNGFANGNVTLGYNNVLLKVDLTFSWDWRTNIPEYITNVTSNPKTGLSPQQGIRGTFFQGVDNDDSFYLYGGTNSFLNTSFPGWQPPIDSDHSLWSYNTVTAHWSNYDLGPSVQNRPSSGAAAEAPDQSLAFYFNGALDNGSSAATKNLGPSFITFLNGMVVINTTDHSARNLSTTAVSHDSPRARAEMQYVPNIGKNGILVLLGGTTRPLDPLNEYDSAGLVPMDEVDIFDVSSLYDPTTPDGVWYKQKTTGENATDLPDGRVDFCVTMASASDLSSHNIYIYGGRSNSNFYYDDIWILSLPSFTWTQVYSGMSPRFGHTCHMIGNRTLLTVGGLKSISESYGETDANSPKCDWESKSVGVLDASEITWGSVYDVHAPAYEVPQKVISTIGGSTDGNAMMKEPLSGFSNHGLAQLFAVHVDESPLPSATPSRSRRSAIIGGTIGGFVGLAIIIVGAIWFSAGQRKKKHASINEPVFEKDVRSDVNGEVVRSVPF